MRKRVWRYKLADGTSIDLSLVDSEKARLRDMARRLEHPASTPEMRESGEAILDQLALLLAQARAAKIGSDVGSAERRAAGEHKMKSVERAEAKGTDPLTIVSERQMRRIRRARTHARRASRAADDLAPLEPGQVRVRVLRAGYCFSDTAPQCAEGQLVRLTRTTAERAAKAGAVIIVEGRTSAAALVRKKK